MITRALLCTALLAFCHVAQAQSVALNGLLGDKALLIVDGGFPKAVSVGQSHRGVKVVAIKGDVAIVEIEGQKASLRVGEAPASVGSTAGQELSGTKVVLAAGPGGHFVSEGQINGRSVQFLVDTGATYVSMSVSEATRIGLKYQDGTPVQMRTANGATQGWAVRLDRVRVGDALVTGIDAVVIPQGMPYILLGNSFLGRFQMSRNNDQMILERRY